MKDEVKNPADLPADWRDGLDEDLGALVRKKGWRSARDVLASYRNLEKLVGGERLAVPAPDAGAESWGPVWEKLGRPKDAAGYQLTPPPGLSHDGPSAEWFRETAFELGLSQTQAQKLHDAFIERFGGEAAEREMPDAEEDPDLKTLWGRQYDRNMTAARRAYGAFLGDEKSFEEIADGIGETALMNLLAKVGRATAEDSITARADAKTGAPRSPAEAMSEIAKLQQAAKGDPKHPYVNKTHPDHAATVKRMEDLFAVAYGR
ncbi:hypothetical protein [Dongia sp.]|uniref:hypothetical protein n=1 Tax=Dongia sp. TaxID=1977262 RepID=UPI0035AED7CE